MSALEPPVRPGAPTWPLVERGQILCPVCRRVVASLAMIDYKGHGLTPDFQQTLLGPLVCGVCGWRKPETNP